MDEITLRQLRYFLSLCEAGHYRKAAERAGISQPSLSQQIVRLESALGVDLVERGRRGAVLTPAGREVREQARKVVDEIETLVQRARAARDGIGGTLHLGTTPTLGPYLLPFVTRRLHRAYPALKLVIRDAAPRSLQDDLTEGRHDMILTQLPVQSADLDVMRLFREPLKLAVAQDHPLAGQARVEAADLYRQDVLSLSDAYLLHGQMLRLCEDVGARLRQDYEGTSLDALRQMTALGMGVSFLPALYVRSEVDGKEDDVAIRPFRDGRLARSIGLAWRRRAAHAALARRVGGIVQAVVQEHFADLVTLEG
ncbi:Hydrogen peroxide-inducible genes activator [Roseovarius sp. THAF8]|uniref:hydrogen peroxide-inducible genes activator n=1 Tax=Roseovarius sp. THAF8 TaxID=2587846 RepID=UPI001267E621|nr:hydrogen peroxide-inducible genes activator [Roseovarius sp. THAF8]QFT99309.1 Hydrogen peroxide-inducible genes activator [Roseovarius sp. THAF8]